MSDILQSQILEALPDARAVRARLTTLAREANILRSLLRILERHPGARGRTSAMRATDAGHRQVVAHD
jgi:hypothetical protein